MPTIVNTELTSGVVDQRFVKPIEAVDVAEAIVGALEVPRFDVYVPKSNGALLRGAYLMPRAAAEWVGRTMGTDKLMTEVDHGARAAYEDRVAHSGGDGPPADEDAPADGERACRARTTPRALTVFRPDHAQVWSTGQMAAGAMGKAYDATWGRAFARFYDRALKATEENGLGAMRGELLAGARGRVIEIGAGTGVNLELYGDGRRGPDPGRARSAHGRAAAQTPRGAAREPAPGAARRGARRSAPFPDDTFDTAVATLVLCTIPDPVAAIDELARVLNPAADCSSSSTSAPRTPRAPAGRTASKSPGASSPTAATATATPRPTCAPRRSRSRRSTTPRCRRRCRSSAR